MPKSSSHLKESAQVDLLKKELRNQRAVVSQLNSENCALRHKIKERHHLRQRIDTVRAVLFSIDLSYQFTFASPNVERYTGRTPQQIRGRSLMDFIHPDDIQEFSASCLNAAQHTPQTAELRLGIPEKKYQWIKISIAPLLERATCNGIQGVFIEIAKDRPAKDMPATPENTYRNFIDNLREGFFESDLEGRITFCNKAMLALSGCSRENLLGKHFRVAVSARTARAITVKLARMYRNSQKDIMFNHIIRYPSGRNLNIEFSIRLISNAEGEPVGFQGLLRDVSEQIKTLEKHKREQAQLNHSRKMNALGTLAGGVAHGFNNLLMTIQGNLSLIRMHLQQDHPVQKHLKRISESTEKGGHLAREILSFAKIGKFVVMPTNLNKIIRSTHRMFSRTHPHLCIHESLDKQLWQTRVDRVQIGQTLLSLYANALDSMPNGGNLYLQSENITLDGSDTQPFEAQPGPYVKISVTDSGMGLEDEAKERIFEPFYSAYHPSRYNSLGLAAAYGTIKSHQGMINVNSKKGHGSTISLYLPAEPENAPPEALATDSADGAETILLVDDDEMCSQTCRDILERTGYRVLIAGSGSEAIELYAHHQDQIHLVLLDVVLPDISGEQIFQELKRCNPNATVIVISGYRVDQQVSVLLNQGCVDFIQKPFPSKTLTNKVRAALDRKAIPPAIAHLIS